MRTGHRDQKSLKSYQNLKGGEGIIQKRGILRNAGEEAVKRLKDSNANRRDAPLAYNDSPNGDLLPPTTGHVSGREQ